jgi:hypothetical protein
MTGPCSLALAVVAQVADRQNPVVDPVGMWLAFVDEVGPSKSELLAARLDPRGPTFVLSGTTQPLTDIALHQPHRFVTGGRMAYLADSFVDQRFELWSVGADLTPMRLSGGGAVHRFETDPARTRVLFAEGTRLHVRAVDGASAALQLGPADALEIVALEAAPDGARVAFVSKHAPLRYKLWIQPIDASQAPTLLEDGLALSLYSGIEDEESIARLTFTPDGARLLFGELSFNGLFATRWFSSIPTDASAPSLRLPSAELAPEKRSVVNLGPELSVIETDVVDGSLRMVVGAKARRVEPSWPLSTRLGFSEDGQRFTLTAQWTSNAFVLYSAPRSGGARFLALADLPSSGHPLVVGSAGVTLVYEFRPGSGAQQLWSVPLDGSAPALLVGHLTHWTTAPNRSLAARVAGNDLVFLGTLAGQPLEGLWRVALDGGTPPELLTAQPIDPLLLVGGFVVGTDRTDFSRNLWGVPLDGSFAPQRYD